MAIFHLESSKKSLCASDQKQPEYEKISAKVDSPAGKSEVERQINVSPSLETQHNYKL